MENNDNMLPLAQLKKVLPFIQKAWDFQSKGYGTTFIYMSGHVATLEIKLYVHGWALGREEDLSYSIGLEDGNENHWKNFSEDRIKKAINEIDYLIADLPTEKATREKADELELERQRKQYETLKAKFETAPQ